MSPEIKMLACAAQGLGSSDGMRMKEMLVNFKADYLDLNRDKKIRAFWIILKRLRQRNFDLFFVEGTGAAAGLAAIIGKLFFGTRYVISSGDAVAPFLAARFPRGKLLFSLYERLLCHFCAGFVGWSPYLVGRALTFGAKRGVTIPGWAPYQIGLDELELQRVKIRNILNIPADAMVYGIVGSLTWSSRFKYCYGLELIKAAKLSQKKVYILIVGDGTGLDELKSIAGDALGKSILLPGRVPREMVPGYLAAMDVGSLPQTTDRIGSFRYTTKIAEYRMVGLPFVTSEIPMSYDINNGDILRLPGEQPWSDAFIDNLVTLMGKLTKDDIIKIRSTAKWSNEFEKAAQIERITVFLKDLFTYGELH